MRFSKRDFLRMLGGGTAATAALAASGAEIEPYQPVKLTEKHVSNRTPVIEPVPHASPGFYSTANFYDVVDRILFDRIHFQNGFTIPANFRMFSHPIGELCPYSCLHKTHVHTNMHMSGCLSAPSLFWVRRIHLTVDPDSDPEALRAFREYAWSFWLGQKRYHDGTVTLDAQLHKWVEFTPNMVAPARESLELHASNGLFIPAMMHFGVEFQSDQARTIPLSSLYGLDFTFALEGVEARGVQ